MQRRPAQRLLPRHEFLGGGQVATNDILAAGRIDVVPFGELTAGRWRLAYRGWAPPEFPHAARGASRVG